MKQWKKRFYNYNFLIVCFFFLLVYKVKEYFPANLVSLEPNNFFLKKKNILISRDAQKFFIADIKMKELTIDCQKK